MSMQPTIEQANILEAAAAGKSFKVLALAGTGKTSTAREIARRNPHKRILYLAFSRPIANEAKGTFPSNVTVKTAHALAYAAIGNLYRGRIETSVWSLRAAIGERFPDAKGRTLSAVLETLNRFCASADPTVRAQHVGESASASAATSIARLTQNVYETMVDPNESLAITHDIYFKAWSLSKPRLPYDQIQFDEAQDSSAVMLAVVACQPETTQRIFIGDSNQSIYGFRYAVNAIESIELPAFPLTQSFRFGDAVARVANAVLRAKDETLMLRGRPNHSDAIGKLELPDAILARTNAGLFAEAVRVRTLLAPEERFAFIGGVETMLSAVLAAHGFWDAKERSDTAFRSKHKEFRFFTSWNDLEASAETDAGRTFKPFVKIAETYGSSLPGLCDELRALSTQDVKKARVTFSTVHGGKGLEWECVKLAGDFMPFCGIDRSGKLFFKMEEANLTYVAITRAERVCDISAIRPVLSESIAMRAQIAGSVKRYAKEVA